MKLDYGDPSSFWRFTGKAFFLDDDGAVGAGYVHLGNITATKLDPKVERKDIFRFEGGRKVIARTDVIGYAPEYSIEGDEYYNLNVPLLFFGTAQADDVQASATSTTLTLTDIIPGMWYSIAGKRNVTVTGVTIATVALAASKYVVDAKKGLICFLAGVSGGAVTGDDPVVTYTAEANTQKHYKLFDKIQRTGSIMIYAIDGPEDTVDPNNVVKFKCDLFPESLGDFKPDDRSTWKITARLRGGADLYARAT